MRVVDLRSIDGSTAETLSVVLEAGIFIVVSFTESNASLDGHVLGIKTGVVEKGTLRGTWVREASSIDEGSKIGTGRLSRLFIAPDNVDTDARNESEGGRSSNE